MPNSLFLVTSIRASSRALQFSAISCIELRCSTTNRSTQISFAPSSRIRKVRSRWSFAKFKTYILWDRLSHSCLFTIHSRGLISSILSNIPKLTLFDFCKRTITDWTSGRYSICSRTWQTRCSKSSSRRFPWRSIGTKCARVPASSVMRPRPTW